MAEQEKIIGKTRQIYKLLSKSHMDTKAIMKILCERTVEERLKLLYIFENEYNLRLCDVLYYRMPEFLKILAFGLACNETHFYASAIFSCVGTRKLLNEKRLLSLIVSANNWKLEEVMREYEAFYGQPLKVEMKRHGLMDEYVIAKIMKAERLENSNVDLTANLNIRELAIKLKNESNNRNIIDVICTQSWNVVKRLLKDGAFANLSSTSSTSLNALSYMLEYADDPAGFWARRLDDPYIACIVAMKNTEERETIYENFLQNSKNKISHDSNKLISEFYPLLFKEKKKHVFWYETLKRKLSYS